MHIADVSGNSTMYILRKMLKMSCLWVFIDRFWSILSVSLVYRVAIIMTDKSVKSKPWLGVRVLLKLAIKDHYSIHGISMHNAPSVKQYSLNFEGQRQPSQSRFLQDTKQLWLAFTTYLSGNVFPQILLRKHICNHPLNNLVGKCLHWRMDCSCRVSVKRNNI